MDSGVVFQAAQLVESWKEFVWNFHFIGNGSHNIIF